MSEFYVTFGQRYRHEEHPSFKAAHPDGWLTIVTDAPDAMAARGIVLSTVGREWSCIYGETSDDRPPVYAHPDGSPGYPLGELGRIDVRTVGPLLGEVTA